MSEEPTVRAAVAVGPTREDAAQAFGAVFDDLAVTTYEDFASEIDLGATETLALADGPGADSLLAQALDAGAGIRVLVEVPGDADRRAWLREVLLARPDLAVVGATQGAGGRTAVVLGESGPGAISGAAVTTLLAAVPPPAPTTGWPEPVAGVSAEPGDVVVPEAPPRRAEAPPSRAGILRRLLRRRAVLLGGVVVVALVAALALVLIGRSDLGADGVLVTTTSGIALLQVLTGLGVAYVILAVRRSRADVVQLRKRMVKQGLAARRRSSAQGKVLTELRNAAGREQLHHDYVVELGRQLTSGIRDRHTNDQRLHLNSQRQTQALLNLRDLVHVEAAVPPAGGWAASPDLLLFCVDTLLAEAPDLVVECGSGLSTLFLSLAASQHGMTTRIVALEHEETFASATRALLERHGVGDRAEVRLAPLRPTSILEHETPWYAESALEGLDGIGLLLVDGPPTATGPQARFPAVPLMKDRFADRCTIVMDDLVRAADHETARRWATLLPDFEYSVLREFEKHVGLLRRT